MNASQWMKINEAQFGSVFEQAFAVRVLANVEGIDFSAISVQYHFKDLDGKDRYCDFVIREGSIKIAIEIDGYDKRNTGQGMSHDDFVDWQRRQAALTAQGWYVLRFANRDVINEPCRCQRYIELLLRDQRSKSQHQANLEKAISRLSYELQNAQSKLGSAEQVSKLQRELDLLKNQLKLAQNAKPLTTCDKDEMVDLLVRLEQEKNALNAENKTMKTTVWAFTVIVSVLIIAGAYVITSSQDLHSVNPVVAHLAAPTVAPILLSDAGHVPQAPQLTQPADLRAPTHVASVSSVAESSCDAPIDWRVAKSYVDQRVAVRGVVAEYRHLPNGRGSPTWINLGAKYPVKERFSIVIWGDHRNKFGRALSDNLVNRQICVIGTVTLRDGTPQMALKWPEELVFQ